MNKTVSAAEFEANSAKLLDDVSAKGETVVVTRNGEPVATMSPIERRAASPFGCMAGTFAIVNPDDDLSGAHAKGELADWERSLDAKADRLGHLAPGSKGAL